ncbi:MAG: hypothetical protein ABI575_03105 [Oxalobacteraceae bacterium]
MPVPEADMQVGSAKTISLPHFWYLLDAEFEAASGNRDRNRLSCARQTAVAQFHHKSESKRLTSAMQTGCDDHCSGN